MLDEAGGLSGVQVSVAIPGCEKEYTGKSNKKGGYEIKVPTTPDFSPFIATVTYIHNDYATMMADV